MKLTTLKKELFVNFKLSLSQNNNQLLIYERDNELISFSNEATNFLQVKFDPASVRWWVSSPDTSKTDNDKKLTKLAKLLQEYLETPIKERFTYYQLPLGTNDNGDNIFICKIASDDPLVFGLTTAYRNNNTYWAEPEIKKLIQTLPSLSDTIKKIMVPVLEDNEDDLSKDS